jgi:hypothetical protein
LKGGGAIFYLYQKIIYFDKKEGTPIGRAK